MKTKNFFRSMLLCILLLSFTYSCERDEESEEETEQEYGTAANPYGNWKRGDGITAYVKFENSKAYSCDNTGKITEGTFNSTEPSMTFTVQGNVYKFPLKFYNDGSMLMGVPNQAISTNTATIYYRSDRFCESGSGGGTGGGGGTGSGQGKAMFWTSSDLGCGNITVTLSGSSGTINQYYSTSTPDCGAAGCANFTLPAGSYNFSASCSGKTWSGSVTVTADGCSRMRLTN